MKHEICSLSADQLSRVRKFIVFLAEVKVTHWSLYLYPRWPRKTH